jgi:hypothetical protein
MNLLEKASQKNEPFRKSFTKKMNLLEKASQKNEPFRKSFTEIKQKLNILFFIYKYKNVAKVSTNICNRINTLL